MRKTLLFLILIFWANSIFSESESKSQPEIRKEKKFQIGGFKIGNKYNSILLSYNITESFTFGIHGRITNSEDAITSTVSGDKTRIQQREGFIFLQWFPFKIGGLYITGHAGLQKIREERTTWFGQSDSKYYYESYSINLTRPIIGAGVGYRWVFENGISLGIEYIEYKNYNVFSPRNYNSIIHSERPTTLMDYAFAKFNSPNYTFSPFSFFFSIGYSF